MFCISNQMSENADKKPVETKPISELTLGEAEAYLEAIMCLPPEELKGEFSKQVLINIMDLFKEKMTQMKKKKAF